MDQPPYLINSRYPERLTIARASGEDRLQTILGNGGEISTGRVPKAVHRHQTGAKSSRGVRAGLLGRIGLIFGR